MLNVNCFIVSIGSCSRTDRRFSRTLRYTHTHTTHRRHAAASFCRT